MQILKETWSIKQLKENREAIDPRPQYQRAPVWDLARRQLLIDSIFRGYDIPKIYLKGSQHGDKYSYEITDGQQRFNALLDFYDGKFILPKNTKINNINISGLKYDELSNDFKDRYDNFDIHVSYISESEAWELNDLFTRLQKGVSLIPVELRHAMMGEIRDAVQRLLKHSFFNDAKIDDRRFKRQDYLDHAIAECYFKVKTDLKAPTLYALYSNLSDDKETVKIISGVVNEVLSLMEKINKKYPGLFKNKWAFVDVFSVVYRNLRRISSSSIEEIANTLNEFEIERKRFVSTFEELLTKGAESKYKRDLYDYIQAFTREGAFKHSVEKRYMVMEKIIINSLRK